MDDKKLFLLDAYALIYRAFYALIRAPRRTADGRDTSAIFGFCNTLDEILRKENPAYMAVCFDPAGGHTFRHEAYPEYKAQRDKQPEAITLAVPVIKDIVEAWGIRVIEKEKYEADDVIGTLATEAEKSDFITYMMTPDKDYGQLVRDKVLMYRPALKGQGFEIRGPQEVRERYGISDTRQIIDLLALEGDTSDNIPGCPGVGPKTAAKLIEEFGSVENLVANTDRLKENMRRKIEDNAKQILFSKFLVTIKTDVPLDIRPEDLRRSEPDLPRLREIYRDLEFKTLLTRLEKATPGDTLNATPAGASSAPDASSGMGSLFDEPDGAPAEAEACFAVAPENVVIAASPDDIVCFAESAAPTALLGMTVYAIGEEAMTARLHGIAISAADDINIYIPAALVESGSAGAAALQPILARPGMTVASHDVKRDMLILRRLGIDLSSPYYDTAVAHYLLKPEMKHDLADVAMSFTGRRLPEYELSATERRKPLSLPDAEIALRIAAQAATVRCLVPVLNDALAADGTARLMTDVELPLVRVLADMEWTGVRIDSACLAEMSRHLTARMNDLEQKCFELAGGRFNIGSPSQVGEILFGRLKIDPKAKRTKTGAWSTTEEILEKHRHKWPIVDLILQIRGLRKLLTTYVDALPKLVNPATGKIHTTYNQTVTATGRISSTNPNLQNIPIRTDEGRPIRAAFVADPGHALLSADYSQIELRLMADLSGDPAMVEAFLEGEDIHRATAAKIYHEKIADVTDGQRRNAKTANFGIIYGISAFGLSERLGIPRAEAKELIDGYMRTYPRVEQYMQESIGLARTQGYVTTVMGRKRYLPEINSRNAVVRGYAERNAINAPLQGSAADIIKVAMVAISRRFGELGLRSRMIMQVHDELIFDVIPDELGRVQEIVTSLMENAYRGRVPLTVSAGAGTNWLEAH